MRLIDEDKLLKDLDVLFIKNSDKINLSLESSIYDTVVHAPTEMAWIPCNERLPDPDVLVLVTCQPKKGPANVNRAYYADGYWHGSGSMSGVVAWMPLPEPYREEE